MRINLPKLAMSGTCLTLPRTLPSTTSLPAPVTLSRNIRGMPRGGTIRVIDAGKIDGHFPDGGIPDKDLRRPHGNHDGY